MILSLLMAFTMTVALESPAIFEEYVNSQSYCNFFKSETTTISNSGSQQSSSISFDLTDYFLGGISVTIITTIGTILFDFSWKKVRGTEHTKKDDWVILGLKLISFVFTFAYVWVNAYTDLNQEVSYTKGEILGEYAKVFGIATLIDWTIVEPIKYCAWKYMKSTYEVADEITKSATRGKIDDIHLT